MLSVSVSAAALCFGSEAPDGDVPSAREAAVGIAIIIIIANATLRAAQTEICLAQHS